MKNNKKTPKVLNKTVTVKFKTKSGKTIKFTAIKTSLKPVKSKRSNTSQQATKKVGSTRGSNCS